VHVCAQCPKVLGNSCCEVEVGEQLATLTLADCDRIAAHTGRAVEDFCESEWLSVDDAAEYEARRPLYRGYFRHGPQRLTLKRRDGACVFLDRARGCTLTADVRPSACRLYPFELWPDGTWSLQVERAGELVARDGRNLCLAVEEANAMEDVLGAMEVSREQVEQLGHVLSHEVADHARRTSPGYGRGREERRPRRS
jgi:uncharacterized protein